jgi:hypothetical protein
MDLHDTYEFSMYSLLELWHTTRVMQVLALLIASRRWCDRLVYASSGSSLHIVGRLGTSGFMDFTYRSIPFLLSLPI